MRCGVLRGCDEFVADREGGVGEIGEGAVDAQGEDLQSLAAIVRGHGEARALDLGCGGGHVSFHVAPHVREVVAYDLSEDMLAAVQQAAKDRGLSNILTRQGAVERLPFEDASFDFVLSRFSAHHWRDFDAGLGQARRVMKRGARAVFADAYAPGEALLDTHLQAIELLRDHSHVRDYSLPEWLGALGRAGFAIEACRTSRLRLDFPSWIARMRTPEDNVKAIRALQNAAAQETKAHFAIEPDGSFVLDTMVIEASRR